MHNARLLSSTFFIGLLCAGLASCDPREFDDLADTAWVQSNNKPSDLEAVGYGIGLVNGGGDSLHYIALTEAEPAAVMVKFDQDGNASTQSEAIRGTLAGAQALTGPVVMASDPDGFASANGNVAVATLDDAGDASIFMIRGENGTPTVPFNLSGGAAISGMAFGTTNTGSATDLLAVAGSELNLIADYQSKTDPNAAAQSCAFVGDGGAVLLADVNASEGDEILVAIDGSIQITTGAAIAAAADAEQGCFDSDLALASIDAPDGEASFGSLLLSADFDGNSEPDLVIAAGDQNAVYVFMNYSTETPSEGVKVTTPANATDFGISIAAGDFDDDGRDELVIGDPLQRADGHARAGVVYLYTTNASGIFQGPIELYDASPENDQNYGQSLAVTKAFGRDKLVVGAHNEVFTYFRTPLDGDVDFRFGN